MAAVALALIGSWVVIQVVAGRLPARVLSFRAPAAGVPSVSAAGYTVPAAAPTSSGPDPTAIASMPATVTGGTRGALSEVQVARVALNAGLSPEAAVIATGIAMRESHGVTTVHNPVPPDDSYGLWQINRLAWPQYSPAELQTAEGNARAMVAISNGGANWQPWTTSTGLFTSNTDMTAARAAVQAAMGGG